MADSTMTKPDLEFVRQLKAAGGESVKKCFQCATCSVVCKLSPDDRPYPRKEMIWAQWGQREKLLTDPDVWLCHQCNDCSTYCPRGARPGDVLAAIRKFAVQHYAVPGIMGKIVGDPKYILLALLIPVVFILGIHYAYHGHWVWTPIEEGHIHYSDFFPHLVLNLSFGGVFTLVMALAAAGGVRFWKDMKKARPAPPSAGAQGSIVGAMVATAIELFLHGKFRTCGTSKNRSWIHMGIFWGFAGLFVVTGIVVIMLLIAPDSYPINTLTHPLKIAGNLFGILLIGGALWAIYNRLTNEEAAGKSSYFDWFFLITVLMVGLTGMATQMVRFREMESIAYPMYFAHLVFTFMLLMYLPYTKFAHMIYRFTAITYAKHIGLLAGDAAAVAAHGAKAAPPADETPDEAETDGTPDEAGDGGEGEGSEDGKSEDGKSE